MNRRIANLLAWLDRAAPDVVCLQELKAADTEFPEAAIRAAGYAPAWVGQRTWNGVAILSRHGDPVVTRRTLPGDPADTQARYLEAAIAGHLFACLYAPNGNPQPGPKFDYKLAWLDRLQAHADALRTSGAPAILLGDFNVVPTEADIYPTRSWDKDALVQPEARERYRGLLDSGWTDTIRTTHPDRAPYTFWSYWRNRWERDAGLRIDHILLSPPLADRLVAAGVDRDIRGAPDASDHAPVWATLRDPPRRARR